MMMERELARKIMQLKPGFEIMIDRDILKEVTPSPGWTAAEWVMESITGSAYEFTFRFNPESGNTSFRRLREPLTNGLRTYVSPDRRHHVRLRPDGLYEPLPVESLIDDVKTAVKKMRQNGVVADTIRTAPMSPERFEVFKAECDRLGIKWEVVEPATH